MSRLLRLFRFVTNSRRVAKAKPRSFRPLVEQLEDRWLMSATPTSLLPTAPALSPAQAATPAAESPGVVSLYMTTCSNGTITNNPATTASIANTFAGVGFQESVVGYLYASLNGQPYTNLNGVQGVAKISWGDGYQSNGDLVDLGAGGYNGSYEEYAVKGSHRYQQTNPLNGWSVSVYAQTPGGPSASGLTATAFVSPMPSHGAVNPPTPISNPATPENVSLYMTTCSNGTITNNPATTACIANTFTGVGFQENVVGYLYVSLNGQPYDEEDLISKAVQINWGDGASWSTGDLVDLGAGGYNGSYEEYAIKGTHTYQQTNPLNGFPIVVYAQGPDGTSASGLTATDFVSPMPSHLAVNPPASISPKDFPADVSLYLTTNGNGTITNNPATTGGIATSFAGEGFQNNVVGYLYVSGSGQPDTYEGSLKGAVQINWGDGASWSTGGLVDLGAGGYNGSYEVYQVTGSHVYQQTSPLNGFPIVVYAQASDGTSISGLTATAAVAPNPDGLGMGNPSGDTSWDDGESGFKATISISADIGIGGYHDLQTSGLPAGLTASLSGNIIDITGKPTQSGTFPFSVSFQDGNGVSDYKTFTLTINAPVALGALSTPTWKENETGYKGTIKVTGGSGSYSGLTVSGLPAGLTAALSGNTITITGTPTQAGAFSVKVSLKDSLGDLVSATDRLTIYAPLALGGLSPAKWDQNETGYNGVIKVSGGSGVYSGLTVSGLPAGLKATLSGGTISLTGTPTTSGSFAVKVSVKDSIGDLVNTTDTLTIDAPVKQGGLSVTTWKQNATGYDGTIKVSGGSGTYSNLSVTGLPAGLKATLSGGTITITGTPTQAGTFKLVVSVQDSNGDKVTANDTLTITAATSAPALPSYYLAARAPSSVAGSSDAPNPPEEN
jgi:hypothetical protein